jgi:hypothetical protein
MSDKTNNLQVLGMMDAYATFRIYLANKIEFALIVCFDPSDLDEDFNSILEDYSTGQIHHYPFEEMYLHMSQKKRRDHKDLVQKYKTV